MFHRCSIGAEFKAGALYQPWNGAQCHCNGQTMEWHLIALRCIANPTDEWTNGKHNVALQKHKESVTGWKSKWKRKQFIQWTHADVEAHAIQYRSIGKCSANTNGNGTCSHVRKKPISAVTALIPIKSKVHRNAEAKQTKKLEIN